MLVRIDNAGRVTLPKDVRDKLATNPGDLLKISVQGDQVTLHPIRATGGFVKRGRALIFSAATDKLLTSEVVEAVRHQTLMESSGNIHLHKNSR